MRADVERSGRRQVLARASFWLCVVAVLVLSVLPPAAPIPTLGWDKANHLFAFFVLALLAFAGWPLAVKDALLGLLLFGVLIEALQALLPYRSASLLDLLADGLGLLLAVAILRAAAFPRRG